MTTTQPHPSGRIQIIDAPVALPGKCAICGIAKPDDERKFIDFGFELDFYGVVYFCTHCFTEIAAAIGWIAPNLFETVEEENLELSGELSRVKAENVKLRNSLSGLDFLGTKRNVDTVDLPPVEKSETKPTPKQGSAKQINESGRANVRETKPAGTKSKSSSEFDDDFFDSFDE